MKHIWYCDCGHTEVVDPNKVGLGRVYQCSKCLDVFGCLYPQGGGRAWVKIDPAAVEFHRLIEKGNEHDL